ncbi:helix-turn-helix domain-containing protein [Streptomyces sp. NPDC085929]|uniref:helix-turn-helix domain-containing protein n=1 Tax=Streptomyces sp. NPDC085929 TaxID=3365739 RepID=UPI0037D8E555
MAGTGVERERSVSVSTNSVSARDGFEWWSGMVSEAVMPVSITSEYTDRFRGAATSLRLPQAEVSSFSFSPMSAERTPAHVRRSDPECYPHDRADRLLGTRLSSRTGSGALLAGYLSGLRENADHCDAEELQRLGSVGVDLATVFLAGQLDRPPVLPAETRQQALLARIQAFIDHNLADPDSAPATIAAHHHISVRLLHRLFQQEPKTVRATIRRSRLERSRADLADVRLGHRSIGETAARWGFRDQADFSRAFRLAYGTTPSDFRRTARFGQCPRGGPASGSPPNRSQD